MAEFEENEPDATQEEEETPQITNKHTRGIVRLKKIIKDKIKGVKQVIKVNKKGQPIGKSAKDLQSYLGMQARTMVPINIKDWRSVPQTTLDNLWTDINVSNLINTYLFSFLIYLFIYLFLF